MYIIINDVHDENKEIKNKSIVTGIKNNIFSKFTKILYIKWIKTKN